MKNRKENQVVDGDQWFEDAMKAEKTRSLKNLKNQTEMLKNQNPVGPG